MPPLPTIQPPAPEWVTLPQALRWIVGETLPVLPSYEIGNPAELPYFYESDTSREDLFRALVSGELELHGTPDPDVFGEVKFLRVPTEIIAKAGFSSINWRESILCIPSADGHIPAKKEGFYWVDLRVRWADLYALTTRQQKPSTRPANKPIYTTALLAVVDEIRKRMGVEGPTWKKALIELEARAIASDLSNREVQAIATVLLCDAKRKSP